MAASLLHKKRKFIVCFDMDKQNYKQDMDLFFVVDITASSCSSRTLYLLAPYFNYERTPLQIQITVKYATNTPLNLNSTKKIIGCTLTTFFMNNTLLYLKIFNNFAISKNLCSISIFITVRLK